MKKTFGIVMVLFFVGFTGARMWAAGGGGEGGGHHASVAQGKAAEHWSVAKEFIPDSLFLNLQNTFGPSWVGGEANIHVSHVIFAIITALLGILLALAAARRLKNMDQQLLPEKKLTAFTFFDILLEAMLNLMTSMMPRKHALAALPIIVSFATFILICNCMGLVPGFLTPAESLNTTLALATFSLVTYIYFSIKVHGVGGTVKHLMGPIPALAPLMFPIEALGFFVIRPGSLALRLLGNMFGDHQVLVNFLAFHIIFVPLPVMVLGLLVCVVQTVVFCLLTMVYIAIAVEEHEHEHEHAHDHAHADDHIAAHEHGKYEAHAA